MPWEQTPRECSMLFSSQLTQSRTQHCVLHLATVPICRSFMHTTYISVLRYIWAGIFDYVILPTCINNSQSTCTSPKLCYCSLVLYVNVWIFITVTHVQCTYGLQRTYFNFIIWFVGSASYYKPPWIRAVMPTGTLAGPLIVTVPMPSFSKNV